MSKLGKGKKREFKYVQTPVYEETEFPVQGGRFDGLNEEEYKKEVNRLRKMREERDKKKKK